MAAHTADRRPLGTLGRMTMVAGIHAVALLFIARGLGIVPALKYDPPMITTVVSDPVKEDPPPLNPNDFKVETDDTQIVLPTPVVDIPVDDTGVAAIGATFVDLDKLPTNNGSGELMPQMVSAHADPHHPLSQPPYPAELIRGNIEGAVIVEVFVQPDGRVVDARIVKSSGYDAFDRNTLNEAKRKWRLLPATQDGSAIPQWYRTRVVFKLTNQ
jgi:protein TonB